MEATQLLNLTINEVSKLIAKKEVSPVEVVESAIERINKLEGRLNAFITVTREQALKEAKAAEKAILAGSYLGPLHGIPYGLKDLFQTKGVRTTAGSKILADWVPQEDATLVQKFKATGAILVGKNNLHEFAAGPTNINPHYGPARNPWDLERIPGGSSGGSAVAVAASECAFSMGSDTGGSIRIPASFCGIVGLKPTYGRVSRQGGVALSWSLDHFGPMTRTVGDCALVLNAIAGYDPKDPGSANIPVPDFARILNGDIKGLRVGVPKEYFFEYLDPEVEQAVLGAIKVLERLGASVEEVRLPSAKYSQAASMVITWAESSAYHEPYTRTRAEDYGPEIRSRFEVGHFISAVDYLRGQKARTIINLEVQQVLNRVDVLLAPTCPMPAPTISECMVDPRDVAKFNFDIRNMVSRLTRIFNLTGNPAISLPCGFTSNDLPIGMQIVGRQYDEETVLRAAYAYQASTDWHTRRPPV